MKSLSFAFYTMAGSLLTSSAFAQEGDDEWIKSGTGMIDKLISAIQTYSTQITILAIIATLIAAAFSGQANWPRTVMILICGIGIAIAPEAVTYLTSISK